VLRHCAMLTVLRHCATSLSYAAVPRHCAMLTVLRHCATSLFYAAVPRHCAMLTGYVAVPCHCAMLTGYVTVPRHCATSPMFRHHADCSHCIAAAFCCAPNCPSSLESLCSTRGMPPCSPSPPSLHDFSSSPSSLTHRHSQSINARVHTCMHARAHTHAYLALYLVSFQVERLARKYLRRPVVVNIGTAGRATDAVTQRVQMVKENEKPTRLEQVLQVVVRMCLLYFFVVAWRW